MSEQKLNALLEAIQNGKFQVVNADKIIDQIIAKMERNCDSCADQIVCFAYSKPEKENCPDWQPDFMYLQDMIDEYQHNKD